MRRASCYSLSEEILASFEKSPFPFDSFLAHFFRTHRFVGAQDRRLITDLLYFIIRQQGALIALCQQSQAPELPRARLFILSAVSLLEGSATLTTLKVNEGEKIWLQKILLTGAFRLEDYQLENCPSWCLPLFQETFGSRAKEEVAALHQPAPVDLRINPFKIARPEALALLTSEGFPVTKTPYSPWGLRLGAGVRLRADHPLLKKGQLEFQEEGSQLVALSLPVSPGMTIVDYCAGAGGKTLVLAHRLHHKGVLYATDTVSTRLKRARLRLRRAGVSNVRLVDLSQNVCWRKRHQQQVDLVLVDAPCSGSGTWRRNPDAKWRLTPQDLQELQQKQQEILDQAATLVRPGGILAYATCSLWHIENTHQISIFLGQHKNFISQDITAPWIQRSLSSFPFLLLTPAQHHTDGFFLALLRRQNALS